MDSSKIECNPNPREKANSFSVIFWTWTFNLFRKGYAKVLSIEDLYETLKEDEAHYLGDRLEKEWKKQLHYANRNQRKPNLLKTIFVTFKIEIFFIGILFIITEFILRLASPLLLGRMLQYFKPHPKTTYEETFMYAGALSLAIILQAFPSNHGLFQAYHLGGKMRIAVCSLIYRKALKLNKTALDETPSGKIVNLIANDVNRFDLIMLYLHTMWSAPLLLFIVSYILYMEAQLAALIGIAALLIGVAILTCMGKKCSIILRQTSVKTDERVRLIDEIISGVQVIKMYAWEKHFCALVEFTRRVELKLVRKSANLRGLFLTISTFISRIIIFITISSMIILNQNITVEKIFVLTSLYNMITRVVAFLFVRGFSELAECKISVNRLQSFLMLKEFQKNNVMNFEKINNYQNELNQTAFCVSKIESCNKLVSDKYAITMEGVVAKWCPSLSNNTLENINLKLKKGKLYAVIGTVGSGKSSLLSSILGEMVLLEGNVKVEGTLSYVDQNAWVFGSSVRENILFGQELDEKRYLSVIETCSLNADFAQFPHGDRTIVGERGCSLSGGQKARINLARAVYRQADIYLLDDPLSAVDARVGKHIFGECINRFLQNKTRILVTHQLQFIKNVDGIIVLEQGRLQFHDDYITLLENYPKYNDLIFADKEENLNKDAGNCKSSSSRKRSYESKNISELKIKDNLENMIENSSKGMVKGSVLLQYFKAGTNLCSFILTAVLFIGTQVLVSLNDFYVSFLATVEESRTHNIKNSSFIYEEKIYSLSNVLTQEVLIYFYTGIVLSFFVLSIIRTLVYNWMCMRSSENIHHMAFLALLRTNMRFFDKNSSGRILNRFSKDTTGLDDHFPKFMLDTTQTLLLIAGAIILTCCVNPMYLVPTLFVGLVCYWIRTIYLKTSKNLRRLDGMTRSPVFTHLHATLNGISTIRALQAQNILQKEFDKFQDVHTSSWFMCISCSVTYAFALDLLTSSFITFITLSFLIFKDSFEGADVGLVISQLMAISTSVQWGMRLNAEMINQMMSVERVLEYTQITPEKNVRATNEASLKKKKCKKLKGKESIDLIVVQKDWPSEGTVEFKNVFLRYAENEEPVLKGLNFIIKPTEKVGIVGRTGAGKSSLIAALFRLAPLEGSIEIDGVDTGSISVEDLRSRISIIPQDPVLFSGTLRRNLDPFSEFADEVLWEVLEEVELKEPIKTTDCGLDHRVLDRGSNFSVGQRQLICLARAILRRNRIIVLDEATANVDPQTDALIQKTIREKFAKCTVLTVAHRLNTIIDSDKVIVMDKGQVIEFDQPYLLLQEKNSQFTSLVMETGKDMYDQLFTIAKHRYQDSETNVTHL